MKSVNPIWTSDKYWTLIIFNLKVLVFVENNTFSLKIKVTILIYLDF